MYMGIALVAPFHDKVSTSSAILVTYLGGGFVGCNPLRVGIAKASMNVLG
jgi:hypothetical protein